MDRSERERLRRLMEEAAALPPDDPARKQVEEAVSTAGRKAEEEWLELLRFDEKLRLCFQRVPAAPRLEDDLLAIPDQKPRRGPFGPVRRRWRPMAVAAALILVVGASSLLVGRGGGKTAALQNVALLAMGEHMEESALTVETRDPLELQRALAAEIPFPVVIPSMDRRLSLIGGRRCTLGSHTVVYSRWRDGEARYSLYQFRPQEFRIPNTVEPTSVPGEPGRCRVRLWTEKGRGYALVGAI